MSNFINSSKNFIVVDAGGTSTDWVLCINGIITSIKTKGFNAFTHNIEDIKSEILSVFDTQMLNQVLNIHFYGAGIDDSAIKNTIKEFLSSIFQKAKILPESDLLGAARALYGQESGNVSIIGTGSNACYYDGKKLNFDSASLGFILGDEGSGAYMGKQLIKAIYRNQLEQSIISDFNNRYNLTEFEIINNVYRKPRANTFLASFTPFILYHKNDSHVYKIIENSFNSFFDEFYPNPRSKDFSFVGSIAFLFREILEKVAEKRKYTIKNILQSPIQNLLKYHQRIE